MLDEEISADVGETVTITPTIDFGVPRASIMWSVGGQLVDISDPRIEISSEGDLMIRDAQTSDSGEYTVTAYNSAGTDMDSIQVIIGE